MKRQSELTNVLHMGIASLWFLVTLLVGIGLSSNLAEAQPFAYVTHYVPGAVSVIDTDPSSTDFNKVVSTVNKRVGSYVIGVAITPDGTRAYVTSFDPEFWRGHVDVIDTETNRVIRAIEMAGFPRGVAITPDGTRAYVTHHMFFPGSRSAGSVSVIDTDPGSTDFNKVVSTVEVGRIPDDVAITPDGSRAYVTNLYDGTVGVIDTDPGSTDFNKVVSTVKVGGYLYGVAITPDGTRAYVTSYDAYNRRGHVAVVDTETDTVIDAIETDGFAYEVAITPDGTRAYVTSIDVYTRRGHVEVIDTETDTVIDAIEMAGFPRGVAITPDGTRAYVAAIWSVQVIDTSNNSVVDTLPMEGSVTEVAITPSVDTDSYSAAFEVDRARVKLHQNTSGHQFEVWGSYELEATSDGIDILNKDVTVTLGEYSETVAGAEFVREDEKFHYQGDSGGITEIKIRDNGRFSVKARGLDLSTISLDRHVNPVNFSLQIGGYSGKTEIEFDGKGRF